MSICIKELIDKDGNCTDIYAKGHCDKQEFILAIKDYGYNEAWLEETFTAITTTVTHTYFRNIPLADGGNKCLICKPGKGAYPVTVLDCD